MIRQAISCDICASEKRQTNHWFVAYEQGGELRVSGWNSRHKLRPGSKHLCGQTCLHKLVDEFMAKAIAVRAQRPVGESDPEPPVVCDASLTSDAAYSHEPATAPESMARPTASPAPTLPKPVYRPPIEVTPPPRALPTPAHRPQPELVITTPRGNPGEYIPPSEEASRYASRSRRAEAWERERERELRAMGDRPGIDARRVSNA